MITFILGSLAFSLGFSARVLWISNKKLKRKLEIANERSKLLASTNTRPRPPSLPTSYSKPFNDFLHEFLRQENDAERLGVVSAHVRRGTNVLESSSWLIYFKVEGNRTLANKIITDGGDSKRKV